MAEEFLQGGVCGGIWWNSPRNLFSSSPCSFDIGSNFSWSSNHLVTDDSAADGSSHHFWNQDLLRDRGGSDGNYSDILLDSSMNYRPEINKSFGEDASPSLNPISSSSSAGFPLSSESYSLLQTLFDTDSEPQQESLLDNLLPTATNTYQQVMNSNVFSPSLPTASASNNVPSTFLPCQQSQFIPSSISRNLKSDIHSISTKHEEASVMKKASHGPVLKRPRIQTPSPLPTFKVRKEKLGDRITALQQLVSPFGKTDTASVLHEAIEYIKFLHDQVNAIGTPYLKHGHGSPPLQQRQQGEKDDLKTRGLCLVPISSIYPFASETATDFWTPTFGRR